MMFRVGCVQVKWFLSPGFDGLDWMWVWTHTDTTCRLNFGIRKSPCSGAIIVSHCYTLAATPTPQVTHNQQKTVQDCDVFHGTAPSYLTELISCNDDRLRSTQHENFAVVRTRTRKADDAFTVAATTCSMEHPPSLLNYGTPQLGLGYTLSSHLKTWV